MFVIRIYISALTLIFLLLAVKTRDIGALEAIVVICPLLFMILEMKEELHSLRLLETRVSTLPSN